MARFVPAPRAPSANETSYADRYYSLGILDQAATHYDDHVRRAGSGAEPEAGQRALLLHAALGEQAALERLGSTGPGPSTDRRSTSCQRFVVCAIRRLAAKGGWLPRAGGAPDGSL